MKSKAVAYYRTSSLSGVGEDRDSFTRQQAAVKRFAENSGVEVVHEFYDAAVKGADDLVDRKGFGNLLTYINENNIKIILFETVNRLARDVHVQLSGYKYLKEHGVNLVPVDDPDHFENLEDNPMAEGIMIIMATLSMIDKKMLCKRMRSGIEKKRKETGRCEGRKPVPCEVAALARGMRDSGMTYRAVGSELLKMGHSVIERGPDGVYGPTGREYKAMSVKKMVERK